jgi:hypothetical protein
MDESFQAGPSVSGWRYALFLVALARRFMPVLLSQVVVYPIHRSFMAMLHAVPSISGGDLPYS